MKAEGGFTLLEVMIALAVFALLAASVLSASQYVLSQSAAVQERLFATWLADNQLHELRLQGAAAAGREQFVQSFDQREWHLIQTLTPSDEPGLLKVEIDVRDARGQRLQLLDSWLRKPDE